MKWINDVVFAILAAHVWGSLMLFVWLQAVKRLENKGYTRLLFYLLRAVIVAYLLPLGLGAVLIINEILVLDGRFMQTTPVITMIHELVHYTRKDIWFLTAAKVVEAIHWFNPWTRGLAAQMSQWNEYACDWKVCNKYLGNIKAYLEVLYRVSMQGQEDKTDMYSSIGTQPMKLIGRMEKMINMKNAMKKPKIFGVLAAVAVSFTSAGSALASTGILTGGYRALYELTDVEEDEAGIQVLGDINATADNTVPQDNGNINPEDYVNTGIEFIDVLPIDGYTSEKDQSDTELAASANLDWSLPSDFMRTTKDFWATSSNHIAVSGTITPTGKILRVGIIEPGGIRRCIYATGNFSYNFPLDKIGFYCVYAINDNSEVVNLTGVYATY